MREHAHPEGKVHDVVARSGQVQILRLLLHQDPRREVQNTSQNISVNEHMKIATSRAIRFFCGQLLGALAPGAVIQADHSAMDIAPASGCPPFCFQMASRFVGYGADPRSGYPGRPSERSRSGSWPVRGASRVIWGSCSHMCRPPPARYQQETPPCHPSHMLLDTTAR